MTDLVFFVGIGVGTAYGTDTAMERGGCTALGTGDTIFSVPFAATKSSSSSLGGRRKSTVRAGIRRSAASLTTVTWNGAPSLKAAG
jgi:hypothetical protein